MSSFHFVYMEHNVNLPSNGTACKRIETSSEMRENEPLDNVR